MKYDIEVLRNIRKEWKFSILSIKKSLELTNNDKEKAIQLLIDTNEFGRFVIR